MLLAAGYFDESSDGEWEERVFTVGGYILNGNSAIHLDFRWRALLEKYGIDYFKASELEAGIGAFAKLRDDPKNAPKARFTPREKALFTDIKTDFVNLLCSEEDLIAISATIHMAHLKSFAHDHPELAKRLPPVYQLCGHLVMLRAGFLMSDSNEGRPIHHQGLLKPIFDSHQEYGSRFVRSFDVFKSKNPNASLHLLPPSFEDEKTYRCLQAADLFVYEMRRTVSNYFFEPDRDLRIAAGRLFPQILSTYVLDYDALKSIAEWQEDDSLPIQTVEASLN